MGVAAQEQRSVVPLFLAVVADGLGGGHDVCLVERVVEAAAAVTGGAEHHPLGGVGRVRLTGVVGGDQVRHVDEIARKGHGAGPLGRR